METRISVIMGIFNCALTLPEALDSLLSQTYKGFKVILCDDGSSDDTYAIAQKYAAKYENFILLKNEKNIKLAATLNHCLKYVDTEYVARMDGDDISLPERFEKEIKFLDTHPEYAIVSTAMIYFDESGDWGRGYPIERPLNKDFKYGPPFCHAPCMVRTAAYKAVNGYTANEHTIRLEDYYLWYKMYKKGFRGYNLNEPLYKMRDDKNALCRRKFSYRIKAFKVHLDVCKGLNIPNPFVYPVISVMKAFIPFFIMKLGRKYLKN